MFDSLKRKGRKTSLQERQYSELRDFIDNDTEIGVKRKSRTESESPDWDLRNRLEMSRETFEKFEIVYYKEPIMHTGALIYKAMVKQLYPKFKSTDEKFLKELDDFIEKSRFVEMYEDYIPLHLYIFGNVFIEYLRDDNTNQIVDFITVDPKTMDFKREDDVMKEVLFKDNGEVEGWRQKLTSDFTTEDTFFDHSEMMHIAMNQVNKGQMGIGFIEPLYEDISLKENIEQAKAEAIYLKANPVPIVRFGSDLIPPSSGMKKLADQYAANLADKDMVYAAMPYYYTVEWQVGASVEDTTNELMYSTKLQSSVLGIPVSMLLGSTQGETRAGLDALYEMFAFRLQSFLQEMKMRDLIKKIWELNGKKIPNDFEVEYPPLTEASIKEQIMRIYRIARTGLVDKNDIAVMDNLREKAGLPKLTEEQKSEMKKRNDLLNKRAETSIIEDPIDKVIPTEK